MRNVSHRIQFYCVEGNQTAAARRTAVFIFLLTGTCCIKVIKLRVSAGQY